MQRQQRFGQRCAKRRDQIEQRRLVEERLAGQRRHQPVTALEEVVDDAEGIGLVWFPWLVPDKTGDDPRRGEQQEQQVLARAGGAVEYQSRAPA